MKSKDIAVVRSQLEKIAQDTTGRDWSHFDSLDMVDFVMDVEDYYGIELDGLEDKALTFDQFVAYVHREIGGD